MPPIHRAAALALTLTALTAAPLTGATNAATSRSGIAELRAAYTGPPADWPKPHLDPSVPLRELAPVPPPVHPPHNPYSRAKAELGHRLFFEPRLSSSRQLACASCHDSDLAWADGRTTSFGNTRALLRRNAPSLLNASHREYLFWDGRAASLEDQATQVVLNSVEMNHTRTGVVAALHESPVYAREFHAAFGDADITFDRAMQAIACFERTIVSRRSPFERFLAGHTNALADDALRGLHLFRTQARCLNCHNGPLLTDEKFHNLGLSYYGRRFQDLGRHEVTGLPADVGAFKTPSLRNVARTAPYMHNGLFQLEGVLNLYNAGMPTLKRKAHQAGDPLFPTKSPLLQPLHLTPADRADLLAFLQSLTEPPSRVRPRAEPDGPEPPRAISR